MQRIFHKLLFLFGFLFIAACSGDGCGCEGFVQQPFPQNAYEHTIPAGGQVRLTSSGLRFVESNVPYLLEQFMPGGLNFCIPRDTSANPSLCVADTCANGQNGCQVNLTLANSTITTTPSRTLTANITIGSVDEALSFDYRLGLTVRCEVKLHKKGQSDTTPAQVKAKIPLDVTVDTTSPLRELKLSVGTIDLDMEDVDFKIRGRENFGDTVACGGASLVRGLFRGQIENQIDTMLNATAQNFSNEYLCRKCGSGQPACPSGSSCRNGFCMATATNTCLPNPLGVEGALNFSQFLGDFSLEDNSRVALVTKAGDFATVDTGVSVGLRSGFTPLRESTCVPLHDHPRPPTPAIPRSATLNQNTHPDTGKPFMLGMGLHKDVLQQMLWSTWASGAVCLNVTSDQVDLLSTSTLGALLPSISAQTNNTNRDVAIHIIPQQPPAITLGKNTITSTGSTYKITDSLITVDWKDVDLHVFAYVHDRMTRLFTMRADLLLPVAIAPDGTGAITPVIENLESAIQNMRILESNFLAEDPARLLNILPTILNLALPGIADMVTQPLQMPEFLGFKLKLEQTDITSIDNNAFVAIFANFTRSTSSLRTALQPVIARTHVVSDHFDTARNMPRPYVELDLIALENGWNHASAHTTEYSYRVNGGLWSLYENASRLRIQHPVFALQGTHHIEVRARTLGDDATTSPITTQTSVVIDYEAPRLSLEQRGHTLHFIGHDAVDSAPHFRYRILTHNQPEPDWSAWSTTDQLDIARYLNPPHATTFEVEARDQSGNTSFAAHTLAAAKSALPNASPNHDSTQQSPHTSGGCNSTGSTHPAQTALVLLGFLLFAARNLLKSRKRRPFTLLLLAAALFSTGCDGCQGELKAIKGPELCTFDSDCASECGPGQTGYCDDNACKCTDYCPDGCGEAEFCCFATNACQPLGNLCGDQSCPPGFEFREATITPNRETCTIESFVCECAPLEPIPLGNYGTYSDIDSNAGLLAVSTYNRTHRDLMVGTIAADDTITWYFVDGPPADAPIEGDPAGPRGGIRTRGENVGTHTSIAVDANRNLHVLYRHEDAKTLKYARGTPDPADTNTYIFETTTIPVPSGDTTSDAAVDAGYWTQLAILDDTLHGLYTVRKGSSESWSSELHHISFPTTAPIAELAQHITEPNVIASTSGCADACTDKNIPGSTGLFTTLHTTPTGLIATFYNHITRRLSHARFEQDNARWTTPALLPTGSGPYGTVLPDATNPDTLHIAFMNASGLQYRQTTPGSPLQNLTIHDGLRDSFATYYRGPIGQNVALLFDKNNRLTATFQDAFDHSLYIATLQDDQTWLTTRLAPNSQSTTSHGFYSRMTRHQDQLVLIEFVIDNQTKPNRAFPIIHRLPD